MSEAGIVQIIQMILTFLGIVVTGIVGVYTAKARVEIKETKAAVVETKVAMVTLEKQTNSIKDELVKVTGQAEHAKGKIEGKQEERDKRRELP